MAIKEGLRPGGRSARVQESIHSAVRALLEEQDRASVTVPQIAARAGVTPSTIYRRWGDLSVLLADVALARMRPTANRPTPAACAVTCGPGGSNIWTKRVPSPGAT